MSPFGRILTAMATPFVAGSGDLDLARARDLAAALLESGTDDLVVCGTTGEVPTLSTREKLDLLRVTTEVAHARGKHVLAGTTNNNTAASIKLSQEAEKLGVDGILATVPSYNNPPQEGLYRHFRAIADAVTLPVLLYNVPTRTVRNMDASTTLRLARDVPNVIGVKEASTNYKQVAEILRDAPDGFLLWSGNDADTLLILALGGYGVVSVATHLVGRQVAEMVRAFLDGDKDRAAHLHHALTPIFDALFVTTSPIPLKYALNQIGMPVGDPRLPLVPIDPKSAEVVDRALAQTRVDLLVPSAA